MAGHEPEEIAEHEYNLQLEGGVEAEFINIKVNYYE